MEIYTAITAGGLLERLIAGGYRYAFVSNADNLGATMDSAIPAYMEEKQYSICNGGMLPDFDG